MKAPFDPRFQRLLFFLNGLLPALMIAWDWARGSLGANPIEFVTGATGLLTLLFLALTLLVTPLSQVLHAGWLVKERRLLGLYSFFYGSLHLATYLLFDRGGDFRTVPQDVANRPFILLGLTAFVLLVPLAFTSTNAMIRRLGGQWKKLHRLTYLAAVLGVAHYWMIVKSDTRIPALFAFAFGILFAYRLFRRALA